MPCNDQYQLLDFGDGRRLERFGPVVLDRPCPAVAGFNQANPALWQQANARFEGREEERGEWTLRSELPDRWQVAFGHLQFELKRTDFGHVGLFPEQAENWEWLEEQVRCFSTAAEASSESLATDGTSATGRLRVLNLFAYTGGSTLAAAVAGAEVVHLDAAKNIVAWARRNAALSGLADAPIRWIVEDAMKFAKRELKRGNRYDAVVLDPPSYGHGPHGEVWRLSQHLPRLLALCAELTLGRPAFMLMTCHTPGYDADRLEEMIRDAVGDGIITRGRLRIPSAGGGELPSGVGVRWQPKKTKSS